MARWLAWGAGSMVGLLAGVLLAPRSGRDLREDVGRRVETWGRDVRGGAGRWLGRAAGSAHQWGNRLERLEHLAVRGTPEEPRVRAAFHREKEVRQR